ERAPAALTHDHRSVAFRTGFANFNRWQRLFWRGGHERLGLFLEIFRHRLGAAAFGVGAATKKWSARAPLDGHRVAAFFAVNPGLNGLDRVALGIHVFGVFALGIAGAGEERATAALADHHLAAALLAFVLRRHGGEDGFAGLVEIHRRLAIRVPAA